MTTAVECILPQRTLYTAENRAILPLIPSTAARFLDVGCGTGSLTRAIRQARGPAYFEGITYSPEEAALAQNTMDRVRVEDLNHFSFKQLDVFDCIICSHVLEHLLHPDEVLRALHKHVAPGGVILVALPNTLEIKTRLEFLRGRFRYADWGILDRTHYRFFDRQTSYELVYNAGYDLEERIATGYCPLPGLRTIFPDDVIQRADKIATRLFPGLFATQFVFRGRPRRT